MRHRLFSVILFVAMATSVWGQAGGKPKKFLTAPLTIEDQGSFFIGGVQKVTTHASPLSPPAPGTTPPPPAAIAAASAPHQITIGQMYVQFQVPARKYSAGWPVIMVHGSSHTGACLESTPDGREGWYLSLIHI